MQELHIKSNKKREVVDITSLLNDLVQKNRYSNGIVYIFTTHTTCAITTADLDPGTDADMLNAYEKIVPNIEYKHQHDPSHVGDHIMSSLLGPSLHVPVESAGMVLGSYQRVVLIEFSGPRERRVVINFMPHKM